MKWWTWVWRIAIIEIFYESSFTGCNNMTLKSDHNVPRQWNVCTQKRTLRCMWNACRICVFMCIWIWMFIIESDEQKGASWWILSPFLHAHKHNNSYVWTKSELRPRFGLDLFICHNIYTLAENESRVIFSWTLSTRRQCIVIYVVDFGASLMGKKRRQNRHLCTCEHPRPLEINGN